MNDVIVNHAYETSAISKMVIDEARAYTQKIMEDHSYLLRQNAQLWSLSPQNISPSTLQSNIIKRIDQDLVYLKNLDQVVTNYGEPGQNDLTWSLATNKMTLALNGAKEIISNTDQFIPLLNNQLPFQNAYDNTFLGMPVCNDQTGVFGNSRATYLSTAMLNIHLELLGENSHLHDMYLDNTTRPWVDQAAIAHVTQIPEAVTTSLIESDPTFTQNFTYFYSDDQTPQGFAFVHSGYAFGGQRDEYRYEPSGKLYGPEDCSSWIAKIINSETLFSTIDVLYAYRMAQPESVRGYVEQHWESTEYAKVMNTLTPVFIQDPIKDIQPGLIWASRTFEDNTDHQLSSGKSGHIAVVLGLQENGEVLTLNYTRDMPNFEGFGLRSFPATSIPNKEIMYFSVKTPSLSMQDILSDHTLLFPEANKKAQNSPTSLEIFNHAQIADILPPIQEEYVSL